MLILCVVGEELCSTYLVTDVYVLIVVFDMCTYVFTYHLCTCTCTSVVA